MRSLVYIGSLSLPLFNGAIDIALAWRISPEDRPPVAASTKTNKNQSADETGKIINAKLRVSAGGRIVPQPRPPERRKR
jgi:hypothetical protein